MAAKTRRTILLLCGRNLACGLLVIVMLAATPCPALGQTLREGKAGPFYSRAALWHATDLTEANLRSLYQQLSRELREYRAWTVDVFIDRGDAAREVSGMMVTDKGYDWWLDLYNEFGRRLLPMAEIQSSGEDAVLRVRDSAGICSEVVLSGNNFLRARVNNIEFEILKIFYGSLPPHTEPTPGDESMISVYVRSSAFPSAVQARELTRSLQERFQQKRVMVKFRTDAFFLTDGFFPIMYRFDSAANPPTKDEYEKSKTLYCFCDQPGIPCR
jgi:hypothetical protein